MVNSVIVFVWISLWSLNLPLVESWTFEKPTTTSTTRRQWLTQAAALGAGSAVLSLQDQKSAAHAAPPISIIAQELGYFPVRNQNGDMVYVPKLIAHSSTDQAIELAKILKEKGVTFYGAYWCPHCANQKEVFGKEAWAYINYVECAPKGYGYKGLCKNVDGFPTWRDKRGKFELSGERPLETIAKAVGFTAFDPSLEESVPMAGTACKQPN
jgi:hypothetical protein